MEDSEEEVEFVKEIVWPISLVGLQANAIRSLNVLLPLLWLGISATESHFGFSVLFTLGSPLPGTPLVDFFNDPNVQKYMQEQNLSSAEFLEEEKKLKSDIDYLT